MPLQDPDKLIKVVQDSTKNLLHSFRDKAIKRSLSVGLTAFVVTYLQLSPASFLDLFLRSFAKGMTQ